MANTNADDMRRIANLMESAMNGGRQLREEEDEVVMSNDEFDEKFNNYLRALSDIKRSARNINDFNKYEDMVDDMSNWISHTVISDTPEDEDTYIDAAASSEWDNLYHSWDEMYSELANEILISIAGKYFWKIPKNIINSIPSGNASSGAFRKIWKYMAPYFKEYFIKYEKGHRGRNHEFDSRYAGWIDLDPQLALSRFLTAENYHGLADYLGSDR